MESDYSDDEYAPISMGAWGDQSQQQQQEAAATSHSQDPPTTATTTATVKGWTQLVDPDAKVLPGSIGSGGLHRKGKNYKPIDEEYILNQRLKGGGLPKTNNNDKKTRGNDNNNSNRKKGKRYTTDKPKTSHFSSPKTTTFSSPKPTTFSSQKPTTFSSQITTPVSPPPLSSIRRPPPSSGNNGWGAPLVETPFWEKERQKAVTTTTTTTTAPTSTSTTTTPPPPPPPPSIHHHHNNNNSNNNTKGASTSWSNTGTSNKNNTAKIGFDSKKSSSSSSSSPKRTTTTTPPPGFGHIPQRQYPVATGKPQPPPPPGFSYAKPPSMTSPLSSSSSSSSPLQPEQNGWGSENGNWATSNFMGNPPPPHHHQNNTTPMQFVDEQTNGLKSGRFSDPCKTKYSSPQEQSHQPLPKNYYRKDGISRPAFMETPTKIAAPPPSHNPIVVSIHLELENGSKVPVAIRKLDDPTLLARTFCQAQNILNPTLVEGITLFFKQQQSTAMKRYKQ